MFPENVHKWISKLHVLIKYTWWKDQKFLTTFSIYRNVYFEIGPETLMCQYPHSSPILLNKYFIGKL